MATARARRVGMTGLLDTNVALYLLGGRLAKPMPAGKYAISVITEMELLAWPSLTTEDEKKVRDFVAQLTVCELTPSIRNRAVQLRKAERLKLPIVCATALEFGVELWTNDETLMKVPGLVCRSVALTG
jgi:predicted nucleic acid-binding protein